LRDDSAFAAESGGRYDACVSDAYLDRFSGIGRL
jgi:hypothetical protein